MRDLEDYSKRTTEYLLEILISSARLTAVQSEEDSKNLIEQITAIKKVILSRVSS